MSVRTCASTASQKFASGKREFTIFETFLRRKRVVPVIRSAWIDVSVCNSKGLWQNYLESKLERGTARWQAERSRH